MAHERIKPKSSAQPTSIEKLHFQRLVDKGCLVCRRPANVHHVHSDGHKRLAKRHDRVVGLCVDCHQNGPQAVHRIGHRAFNELHGFDLLGIAEEEWRTTCVALGL